LGNKPLGLDDGEDDIRGICQGAETKANCRGIWYAQTLVRHRRFPKWLVFALTSIFWWGLFGFLAKVGSERVSPIQMYFFFVIGMIPLVVAAILRLHRKVETDRRGVGYGMLNGVFSGLGLLAYYAAMEGGKASIVGPVTSLYPLVTVILAVALLKERLNRVQQLGVGFAITSILILSL